MGYVGEAEEGQEPPGPVRVGQSRRVYLFFSKLGREKLFSFSFTDVDNLENPVVKHKPNSSLGQKRPSTVPVKYCWFQYCWPPMQHLQ